MKQATVCVDDDGVEPEVCVIEVSLSQVVVLFLISLFVGIGTKQGILFFFFLIFYNSIAVYKLTASCKSILCFLHL